MAALLPRRLIFPFCLIVFTASKSPADFVLPPGDVDVSPVLECKMITNAFMAG
jgi:hypothetical protein